MWSFQRNIPISLTSAIFWAHRQVRALGAQQIARYIDENHAVVLDVYTLRTIQWTSARANGQTGVRAYGKPQSCYVRVLFMYASPGRADVRVGGRDRHYVLYNIIIILVFRLTAMHPSRATSMPLSYSI